MHELAVTKQLIEDILARSSQPKKVIVDLGELTTYTKEALLHYFEVLKKEASMGSTELIVNEVKAGIACNSCGKFFSDKMPMCPECYSVDVTIKHGNDLILKSIIE